MFACLLLPTLLLPPSDLDAQLAESIDQAVQAGMEREFLPGVAVVVVREGRTVFQKGYGMADLVEERPVDPETTLFRIGSVTKAMTGLAVAKLEEQGKLKLEDPVSKYTEGVVNLGSFEEPLTVWNLVTHTGGFDQLGGRDRQVRAFERPLAERKALRPSLAEYLEGGRLRRVTPPGLHFRYDTYGISLAGLVVERASGLPYAEAMRRELFAPIGMESSFVEAGPEALPRLAVGYGWDGENWLVMPYEVYATTPASSIDATAADMGRLLQALTGDGSNEHGRLFQPETVAKILSPQYRPHPRFTGISYGFWESPSLSPPDGPFVRSVGHGGTNLGFRTHLEIFPEAKLGVVMLTNRDPEAGGGWIELCGELSRIVVDTYLPDAPRGSWLPADPDREVSQGDYLGNYYNGVFCRSCDEDEWREGAWRRRDPRHVVTLAEGGLMVGDELYLPTAEDDVFVRQDGRREAFFGRGADGDVAFLVFSTGTVTFERIVD